MKQLWDANVGRNFALSELANKIFTTAGGRLDRHGSVPYDQYVALLGKLAFFGGCMIFFQRHSPFPTPSADLTGLSWA